MTLALGPDDFASIFHITGPMFTDGEALCMLGVRVDGAPTLGNVAADLFTIWSDNFSPGQDPACSLTRVDVFNDTAIGSAIGSTSGGGGGTFGPSNTAVLIHKVTGIRGRRARGRMYVPAATPEGEINNAGALSAPLLTFWEDACVAFMTDLDGLAYVPIVNQNVEGNTPAIVPNPAITALLVDPVAGTQRRRMRR